MYYMCETIKTCSAKCQKAIKLNGKTLLGAKRESTRKSAFTDTVLYVGNMIDCDGYIINVVAYKMDNKWHDEIIF